MAFDARAGASEEFAAPAVAGMAQWVYAMDVSISVGGHRARKGSRAGTVSGQ
jgi:hypothetical protein